MKYFFLDTLGNLDGKFCILISAPEGMGLGYYKLANGEVARGDYPADAKIYMTDQYPGIQVPSIVGNTQGCLIVSESVKSTIEALCLGADIEYLPLTLYNHKRRPHPEACFIINPIGTRDCLDLEASEIERLDEPGDPYDGAVVGVDRFVLDPRKLVEAPPLFRVREEPNRYVLAEALADALRAQKASNLQLEEIEQSSPR